MGHDAAVDVRGYLAVFAALAVLTVATVGVSYLHLPHVPAVIVALAIAGSKAALVTLFFMHLKQERGAVHWALALTVVLFAALFAFTLWSEADHPPGTRFTQPFDAGVAAPAQPESHP